MIGADINSPESRAEVFVLYCSSSTTYGIRLSVLRCCAPQFVTSPQVVPTDAASAPGDITFTEYDELSALRKAQAWGAPMFQPNHPRYSQAIARLNQLEAKERAPRGHALAAVLQ